MIARIWHGITPESKAAEYFDLLMKDGVENYRSTPGNRGVQVLRRIRGGEAEFLLISFWESIDAVKGFAGPDIEKAVYYPEDKQFLVELEPTVKHYDVLLNR